MTPDNSTLTTGFHLYTNAPSSFISPQYKRACKSCDILHAHLHCGMLITPSGGMLLCTPKSFQKGLMWWDRQIPDWTPGWCRSFSVLMVAFPTPDLIVPGSYPAQSQSTHLWLWTTGKLHQPLLVRCYLHSFHHITSEHANAVTFFVIPLSTPTCHQFSHALTVFHPTRTT